MPDRITPYHVGSITQRIDEIVFEKPGDIHFEMMSNGSAWMRIGEHTFWFEAKKGGQLIARYSEGPMIDGGKRA